MLNIKKRIVNNDNHAAVNVECLTGQNQVDPTLTSIRSVLNDNGGPQCNSEPKKVARSGVGDKLVQKGGSAAGQLAGVAADKTMRFLRRPDAPRILAAVLIGYFTYTRPALVLSLFFLALLIFTIIYISAGPDAVGRWISIWYKRLEARDPAKAEKLRRRAVKVTDWVAAMADLLPKTWTTGLYLPDFNDYGEPHEKLQSDPFEKLKHQEDDFLVSPGRG